MRDNDIRSEDDGLDDRVDGTIRSHTGPQSAEEKEAEEADRKASVGHVDGPSSGERK